MLYWNVFLYLSLPLAQTFSLSLPCSNVFFFLLYLLAVPSSCFLLSPLILLLSIVVLHPARPQFL